MDRNNNNLSFQKNQMYSSTLLPYNEESTNLFMNELYQTDNIQDFGTSAQSPFVLDHNAKYGRRLQTNDNNIFDNLTTRPGDMSTSPPELKYHHRNSVPNIQSPMTKQTITTADTMMNKRRRNTEGNLPKYNTNNNNNNSSSSRSSKDDDDEEEQKKKNVLERNRQAALKCRQRKKQWIADLQNRVEFLSTDNEQLQQQAEHLREEIINLKTLLLAHRDCKVANQNFDFRMFPIHRQNSLPSPPNGFNSIL